MLRTNIEIDNDLVKESLKLTHIKTKKELVDYALRELVRKKKRKQLLNFEGKIKWTGRLNSLRGSRI